MKHIRVVKCQTDLNLKAMLEGEVLGEIDFIREIESICPYCESNNIHQTSNDNVIVVLKCKYCENDYTADTH